MASLGWSSVGAAMRRTSPRAPAPTRPPRRQDSAPCKGQSFRWRPCKRMAAGGSRIALGSSSTRTSACMFSCRGSSEHAGGNEKDLLLIGGLSALVGRALRPALSDRPCWHSVFRIRIRRSREAPRFDRSSCRRAALRFSPTSRAALRRGAEDISIPKTFAQRPCPKPDRPRRAALPSWRPVMSNKLYAMSGANVRAHSFRICSYLSPLECREDLATKLTSGRNPMMSFA